MPANSRHRSLAGKSPGRRRLRSERRDSAYEAPRGALAASENAAAVELSEASPPGWQLCALAMVVAHHDALRSRYSDTADGWEQSIETPNGEAPLEVVELGDAATNAATD